MRNYSRLLLILMFLMFFQAALAQIKTVTGKVTDSGGNPMPGVSIVIEGTTKGVATDFDGNYTIEAQNGDILSFSFIGFATQKVKVKNNSVINIELKEDAQKLDDVVVVGYGVQKKVNMTGSVNSVKSEDIQGKSATSLTNALQGVTPGVTVISRPGDVGADMGSVTIRGRGNLGSSEPLYIVDGIPVSAGDFQRIPPGDVESISVLKDAAATAIYGARAAYGVFLVTTKKGKEGKASVNYNGYYGFQKAIVLPNKLRSEDFAMLLNEANSNAGKPIIYDKETLEKIKSHAYPDLYPDNDWYDLFYEDTAPIQEHSISLSGGGKTRYFVSGTFFNQKSLVPGTNLNRYSFRANTERQFTEKFKLGTNISFIQDNYEQGGYYNSTHIDRMSPLSVAVHSDGSWGTVTAGSQNAVNATSNPLRRITDGGWRSYETNRLITSLNAEFEPNKDLVITGMLSYRLYDNRNSQFEAKMDKLIGFLDKKPIQGTDNPISELKKRWRHTNNLMAQLYATYSKEIEKHSLTLMAGTQYESYKSEWILAGRRDYPSNSLGTINAGSGKAENLYAEGDMEERKFFSQFGRLNYAFDNKYLFEANVRADQSSQFSKENRLGVFPSFSAAWRISQEKFMESQDWLTNLKLRLSWGQSGYVGNVGYYDYFDVLGIGSAYVTNGVYADGVWPSLQVNKNFTWETVTTKNLGLDASFLNGAIDMQLDVFEKRATDVLLKMPQPYELGIKDKERAATNAGEVSNKGIEMILTYKQKVNDFSYSISGNFSRIWNEIVSLNGLDNQIDGIFIHKVGGSIGDFYGLKAMGVFKDQEDVDNHAFQSSETAPGDIKYADINNDGKITAQDRTVIGNDVPYFTYALNLSASYKGFDLSIQGQGVEGVSVYLSGEASQAFFNGAGAKVYHLGRWTPQNPNPNAIYPRVLPTADNKHNNKASSFWLYDADYFRIKSIILGYTVSHEVSQLIGFQNIRFYLSGTNLFTVRGDNRMKDFDPEMASTRGSYPSIKTLSLGVNISF